ncbi:glycosyl hydrolase family 28-related protein [Cohnella lupini]|uniref:glycosyl hydrolase family 28-related protein n=1 Tax=Cohnella lupini TaxID=1294267 RepID=UPI0015F27CEB|nr:glycosyl hydrolase family 28-related protein [Cohnella lupini]
MDKPIREAIKVSEEDIGQISVMDYGAVGDNVTDDTKAIQKALNDLANEGMAVLYFPPSTYKITSPLIIPYMQGKEIRGATSLQSTVKQYTDNTPVFQFAHPDTHTIYMHDIGISYANQQFPEDVDSYGIGFHSAESNANGFYHLNFERLSIRGAAVGIGINQEVGTQTVWNIKVADSSFYSISKHIVYFNPPTPIGMPMHVYQNLRVINTGDEGIASQGEAFVFAAVEAEIEHLDIEGWHDTIFYGIGGPKYVVKHVHAEHHVFDEGGTANLFYIANGSLSVDNLSFQGSSDNAAKLQLFHSDGPEANLYLQRIQVGLTDNGGEAVVVASRQSDAFIRDISANIPITYSRTEYEARIRNMYAYPE